MRPQQQYRSKNDPRNVSDKLLVHLSKQGLAWKGRRRVAADALRVEKRAAGARDCSRAVRYETFRERVVWYPTLTNPQAELSSMISRSLPSTTDGSTGMFEKSKRGRFSVREGGWRRVNARSRTRSVPESFPGVSSTYIYSLKRHRNRRWQHQSTICERVEKTLLTTCFSRPFR